MTIYETIKAAISVKQAAKYYGLNVKRNGMDIARYSVLHDNDRLFMSKYLTYLPTKEQLKAEIERQKEIFYMQHPALSENEKEGMEE